MIDKDFNDKVLRLHRLEICLADICKGAYGRSIEGGKNGPIDVVILSLRSEIADITNSINTQLAKIT